MIKIAIVNQFKEQLQSNTEDWLSGNTYSMDLGTSIQAESVSDTDLIQIGSIARKLAQTETLDRTNDRLTLEFWFASTDANDLLTPANYLEANQDTDVNVGSTNWVSQSFKVPVDTNITKIDAWAKYSTGSPSPDISVRIEGDDGSGKPDGNLVTNGSSAIPNFYDTSYAWKEGSFGNPPALTANTTYHLVLHASGAGALTEYKWGSDNSSPTYTDGTLVSSTDGGSNWTVDSTSDFSFRVFGNKINENGVFDSQTNGSLYMRNQHSAVTKDTDTEILFTYQLDYSTNINE